MEEGGMGRAAGGRVTYHTGRKALYRIRASWSSSEGSASREGKGFLLDGRVASEAASSRNEGNAPPCRFVLSTRLVNTFAKQELRHPVGELVAALIRLKSSPTDKRWSTIHGDRGSVSKLSFMIVALGTT